MKKRDTLRDFARILAEDESGIWKRRSLLSRSRMVYIRTRAKNGVMYMIGGLMLGAGLYGGGEALVSRSASFDLINNLLLVFTGCFLVFLASHEDAIAAGGESEDRNVGA